ncbi:ETC complex I subunit conserved region [Cohaesibacter sp. ES.047]|uniref:ETC complex I subunit n=1 Tax=Cohaesibacter sp. ES.047 TaxID=1798205 RepID=UPI000BBF3C0B|nr:ETC complex I subunit [Cohaesibacter sp. ES.047]SNY93524.1 ETC complex I subunit conserved region [Cohaesibacter sp. ES.047]
MTRARIFRPAKNAMQSGSARSRDWQLKFDQTSARSVEPLMGHTSSSDTKQQIAMSFPTKDDAIAYAERHGIEYQVIEPKPRKRVIKAYADNFSPNRIDGNWTH